MKLLSIREKLNKIIFNQSELIDVLSLCILRHALKISSKDDLISSTPSNLLIIGNTGTGKTFSVKEICKITNFPFIEINAKSINQEGWQGTSFIDLIKKGLEPYVNEELRLYPVIYVDEFDKFCRPSRSMDHPFHHEILQATILKYIEGFKFELMKIPFDTSKFCFIFSGAFTSLLEEDNAKSNIGFSDNINLPSKNTLTEKLLKFGLIPELMGRITRIIKTNDITEQLYRDALCNPEFISNKWFRYLREKGIDRQEEPNYSAIIAETVKRNLGFRGLVQCLEAEIDKAVEAHYLRDLE